MVGQDVPGVKVTFAEEQVITRWNRIAGRMAVVSAALLMIATAGCGLKRDNPLDPRVGKSKVSDGKVQQEDAAVELGGIPDASAYLDRQVDTSIVDSFGVDREHHADISHDNKVHDIQPLDLSVLDSTPVDTASQLVDSSPPDTGSSDVYLPKCNDGILSGLEQCDGPLLGGKTCKSLGYFGGSLSCRGDCTLDESNCHNCGDGAVSGTEQCDGSQLGGKTCKGLGYAGGALKCGTGCTYDKAGCYKCGDGAINGSEQCDGAQLGGKMCEFLGYAGGVLKCDAGCKFDKAGCYKCGDGAINGSEQCDGSLLGGKTCKGLGYVGGTLKCGTGCTYDTTGCYKCGDGAINGSEQCDGSLLGIGSCKSQGYAGGTLKCDAGCKYDATGCYKCGDGTINGSEQCDGSLLGIGNCKSQGYAGGTLKCDAGCKYDATSCYKCGDGTINGSEQCDGSLLGGKTCKGLGYVGGTLKCGTGCIYDVTGCYKCGDGAINGTEQCDGSLLGIGSCKSLGYAGGTLKCDAGCKYDKASCYKCGDGAINGSEQCDGSLLGGKTCGTLGYVGGSLACTAACSFDVTGCRWVVGGSSNWSDHGMAVATDSAGNVLVTGSFGGTMTIGGASLTSKGGMDVFVLKLDASGQVIWASSAGGADPAHCNDIAVDSSGNSYITGRYRGSPSFGSASIISKGSYDIFIAKLDPSGKFLWATTAGGAGFDSGAAIAVDAQGYSNIVGQFYAPSATFGTITHASAGSYDLVVARLSPQGTFQWSTSAGGSELDAGDDIAVDSAGVSYVAGHFGSSTGGTAKIGGTTLTSQGKKDLLVTKLDSSGVIQWAMSAGGPGFDSGRAIALGGSGACLVTGYFSATATFGTAKISAKGNDDVFVSKVNSSGSLVWTVTAGGNGLDEGQGIAVDSNGSSYITGRFGYAASSSASFGTTLLTSAGAWDVFVMKLTPSGVPTWATSAGGTSDDVGNAVSLGGSSGNFYVVGDFSRTATFGGTTRKSKGYSDVFIWELGPSGP